MTLLDKTIMTYGDTCKYKNDPKKTKEKRAAFQADMESVFLHLVAWVRCAVFSWQVCSSSEVIAPSGVHFGNIFMARGYLLKLYCISQGFSQIVSFMWGTWSVSWQGLIHHTCTQCQNLQPDIFCWSRELFLNKRASYSVDFQEYLLRFVKNLVHHMAK